ncbi:MAG: TIGR01777 family oxidoreductase, partial [Nevskiales bacterium]
MNTLITGGTGFIGTALCARLQAEGHRVTVLSRNPARAQALFHGQVEIIGALDALTEANAPEAIINLAGENLAGHRWNARWREAFVRSRVGITEQLLLYIARTPRKPRVLVSGSAVGYYGARGDEALSEDSPPGREYQSELCVAWEAVARQAESHGLRVCLLRTGIVLGNNGGALKSMLLPFRLGLGGHLGDGRQWMSWIHRDDLIGIILHLLRHESLRGPYNGTAPEPVTNREFARSLGAALRRPVLMPLPGFLVRLLVGGMAHLLLTGQK